MVEISEGRLGAPVQFAPLPPFATAQDALRDALPVLDPPSRMTVTDAAEKYIRVQVQGAWQGFDRMVTPYMVEPSDMMQNRRFAAVIFAGPSQTGKTMMLQTTAMHAVACDQAPVLVVHMTQTDRDKWVEEKLDPMIQNSPELRDRLGKGRDDSTFGRKRFRGMRLLLGYPTPQTLSGGTYRTVLLTDYDHMPTVLGGKDNPEGSPFRMALQRVKTFLSRGGVLVESSPAWPVTDTTWRNPSDAPHMFPPVAHGVIGLYNQGTRARWYWECPDCHEEFEPRFDRLHYDASLSPAEAGDRAEMECPHCHVLINHRHKVELNRAALEGRGGWRHEAADGTPVSIEDPRVRRSEFASYALNGAAATFSRWSQLVSRFEEARRKAEALDDDSELAAFHYTEVGIPHRRIAAGDGEELSVQFLRDHSRDAVRGVAPSWTRFITVSVDVQGTYFPVQIMAWDAEGNSQIVDRFDLTQPPDDAPDAEPDEHGNRRRLMPARYAEDWAVLAPLAARVIPIAGAGYGLRPVGCVVDFQGEAGVSDNAEAFLKARRRASEGSTWYVSRGTGGWRVPFRAVHERPDRASKGKQARGIKILTMAVDRLKDTIMAGLSKAEGSGKGAVIIPSWLSEDDALEEFLGEERTSKGWRKKPGVVRNEHLDLCVQGRAVAEIKGLLKIRQDTPPAWAVGGPENSHAVSIEPSGEAAAAAANPQPAPAPAKPKRRARVRGRFMK